MAAPTRSRGLALPLRVKGHVASASDAQHLAIAKGARNVSRSQPRGDQTEAPPIGLTAGPVTGEGDPGSAARVALSTNGGRRG